MLFLLYKFLVWKTESPQVLLAAWKIGFLGGMIINKKKSLNWYFSWETNSFFYV